MANAIPGLTRGQLVAGLLFVVVITLLALCLRKTRKDGWSTGCVTMVCICSVLLVALPFVGFWRGRVLPEPVTRWQLALIALAAIVVLAVVWLLSSVGKTDNPVRCGLRRGATSPMKLFYFVLFVLFLAEVGY